MGGHGAPESLAACSARVAKPTTTATSGVLPRQKLFSHMPQQQAVVYSSSERERGRRRKGTAGVASVAKAMVPEFGFGLGSLVPTEAEFR